MEELQCLMCLGELPEDDLGRRNAIVLTDEREPVPQVMGAWCDEKCMGEWLVKSALQAMMQRMISPSSS